MARRYWDNQSMMQRISKHFYPENVFDDSSVDQPKLRWRYRNVFGDGVPHSENSRDDDSIEKTDVKPEPIYVSSDVHATDPLDFVFGNPSGVDEVNRTASSTTVPRRQSRTHKKSKRRQRIQKREASLYSQNALVEDL